MGRTIATAINATVREDEHGLYVRKDNRVIRPNKSVGALYDAYIDEFSTGAYAGQRVNASAINGAAITYQPAGETGYIVEGWYDHGPWTGNSVDSWEPDDGTVLDPGNDTDSFEDFDEFFKAASAVMDQMEKDFNRMKR